MLKMSPIAKSITVALGITLFGLSSYALYLLFQKDEEDEYQDTFAKASKFKTLEIKVPKEMVRLLIGRNGVSIKAIQEQSNTRIFFRNAEDADSQICVVRGSADACYIAENLIQDFMKNQPVLESETISVPIGSVGMIIGRGGEKIGEIRMLSGAKIIVLDDPKAVATKSITIKGTKEQILVAVSLIEEVVQQSLARQQLLETSLAKREPRAPPRSTPPLDSPKAERLTPTLGHHEAPFEVFVSAIVDPSRFWVQIVGPRATELDCLVEEMSEYYERVDNQAVHQLNGAKKGDLVAAKFRFDNKWYRAEILDITEDESEKQAVLFYVDYGDMDTVAISELYELRTDFLRLHFQAIECFLARVDPVGDSWSEEAVDKFEECTHVAQWKKLSAKMNGYIVREKMTSKREGSPVPGVDLYQIDERDIDIAEELVKSGFAVFKKEALLSSSSRGTSTSNLSIAST